VEMDTSSPAELPLGLEVRYKTLVEISRALVKNLAQDTILTSVADLIGRIAPFSRIGLMIYEPETDSRRIFAIAGRSRSPLSRVGAELTRRLQSYAWQAFDGQRPVRRANLELGPRLPLEERLYREGLRSLVALPLTLSGKGIGTLNLASDVPDQYGEAEVTFLEEVAHQIALAIGNIRSSQEIAALRARLEREASYVQEERETNSRFPEIIGKSAGLKKVLRSAEVVAGTDCTVLITGETGTGKELIAQAIHSLSGRKDKPFISVSCSALPSGLVESELFGHEKGAFTGAIARRVGRFELAHGGTLFLDEIGELAPDVQVKLLRVLQEREFERVGGTQTLRIDVRVIAATHRELAREVAEKTFRSDLYYRLNVFPMPLPPLRERREDVPLLVRYFVDQYARKMGKRIDRINQEAMERLMVYDWPGNIRELSNVVERALILAGSSTLDFSAEALVASGGAQVPERAMTLDAVERQHIEQILKQTRGVIHGPKGAARLLGLNPSTLRSRMKKLGLDPAARRREISQLSRDFAMRGIKEGG
jgi:formate hydrogenlyase transcriptional activator